MQGNGAFRSPLIQVPWSAISDATGGQGAPQAEQVADRFHIVQNLRMAIEEQMNLHGRSTGRALLSDAVNISTPSNLLKSRLAHRKSREEIYRTISALRQQRLTCSEIGRRTGFPRRSVAKWLQFETPPDRRRAVLKRSSAWYFEDCLKQSWANGIRRGSALFSMIQEHGYEGNLSNLQRLLAGWRRAEKQEQGAPSGSPKSLNQCRTRKRGTQYPRSSRPRSASNQEENSLQIRREKSKLSRLARLPSQRCGA